MAAAGTALWVWDIRASSRRAHAPIISIGAGNANAAWKF
jgi:hypothetical protein